MSKERRPRTPRASPYPSKVSSPPPKAPPTPTKETKELDEVRCPICLDHPHNAVLLICKSTTKGCHPYICNTGQRHSNCLDQFSKTSERCPLCRGEVTEITVPNARDYLNEKIRSCSLESCNFSGNYKELRRHVWNVHPMDHPSEPDPVRQSEWRRMERRTEVEDLVSTMGQSGDFGDLLTSVVRIPSMSIVLVVRINSYTVSTQIAATPETIVIDDDDDDDEEEGEGEEDIDDEEEDNDDDDEDYVVTDGDETEFEDDCYVTGRRNSRR